MDQSQSHSNKTESLPPTPPRKSLTMEFFVGLFAIVTVATTAWIAVGLGEFKIFSSDTYPVFAEFDNISGLKTGASVEIGGVPIGSVKKITLKDPQARVEMSIKNGIKLHEDDIASIRTKGIIGDRYVKISRGAGIDAINENGTMFETEGVVDIEDLIGKFVHNMSDEKDKKDEEKK